MISLSQLNKLVQFIIFFVILIFDSVFAATAIDIWEKLGRHEEAARLRKLKTEQGAVKVTQKVVHGDEISKTEIKDSVLNRSNVGTSGDDKLTKIKELKELHDAGAIDDDEFKQMKKEILGK